MNAETKKHTVLDPPSLLYRLDSLRDLNKMVPCEKSLFPTSAPCSILQMSRMVSLW